MKPMTLFCSGFYFQILAYLPITVLFIIPTIVRASRGSNLQHLGKNTICPTIQQLYETGVCAEHSPLFIPPPADEKVKRSKRHVSGFPVRDQVGLSQDGDIEGKGIPHNVRNIHLCRDWYIVEIRGTINLEHWVSIEVTDYIEDVLLHIHFSHTGMHVKERFFAAGWGSIETTHEREEEEKYTQWSNIQYKTFYSVLKPNAPLNVIIKVKNMVYKIDVNGEKFRYIGEVPPQGGRRNCFVDASYRDREVEVTYMNITYDPHARMFDDYYEDNEYDYTIESNTDECSG